MATDAFTVRWAIRLPDGNVATAITGAPYMWNSREEAQRALGYFETHAEKLGVANWRGEIVRQLCTPWIPESSDIRAQEFLDELITWLEEQTGGDE